MRKETIKTKENPNASVSFCDKVEQTSRRMISLYYRKFDEMKWNLVAVNSVVQRTFSHHCSMTARETRDLWSANICWFEREVSQNCRSKTRPLNPTTLPYQFRGKIHFPCLKAYLDKMKVETRGKRIIIKETVCEWKCAPRSLRNPRYFCVCALFIVTRHHHQTVMEKLMDWSESFEWSETCSERLFNKYATMKRWGRNGQRC